MVTKVQQNGTANDVVPDGQKVAFFSYAPVKLYKQVGFPNYPAVWELVHQSYAGETYTSSSFSGATNIRLEASWDGLIYQIGASPTVTDPAADITAGDATFTITGTSGTSGGDGGYVAQIGGAGDTTGAGGAAKTVGGVAGATGVGGAAQLTGGQGGATSGNGGAAQVTGGAAQNGNASGGSVVLTGGAKNGSGIAGGVRCESTFIRQVSAPTAKTTSATLTAAELLAGIITINQGGGATSAQQVPTGTAIQNALPADFAVGDSFDVSVINISVVDAEDASVTVNTDVTLVGSMDFLAYNAAGVRSSGVIRFRKTADHVFVGYRIA